MNDDRSIWDRYADLQPVHHVIEGEGILILIPREDLMIDMPTRMAWPAPAEVDWVIGSRLGGVDVRPVDRLVRIDWPEARPVESKRDRRRRFRRARRRRIRARGWA